MPYKMRKTNGYRVTSPSGVRAKATTRVKGERQMRLLRGVEHGWKPTDKKVLDIRRKAIKRLIKKRRK